MRKIDDQGSMLGSTEDGRFPKECVTKEFSSSDGVGGMDSYAQSSEDIKKAQDMAAKQVKKQKQPLFERN